MRHAEVHLHTGESFALDVTGEVESFVSTAGDGLCHVFLPHATAGLALIETGSGSEEDLADAVSRLLPENHPYRHRHGSTGHGASHVLPAFIAPFLVLAVRGGRLILGTWQRVVVVDSNIDNPDRRLLLHFMESGTDAQ